ncbi:uncharacterized protein LOC133824491 isoform X1 [Humulus lupulus]|uniref:uncharacterized protein LOC133824491 isoform X1 n=1 Tax=Humulus lupulus TaxID=3486 RepID=UPI002B40C02C|nr:uncharacterized protein LOC133824491 isoform X1 [Humulus lupulus]
MATRKSTCVAVKSGWLLLVKACCEAYYLYNAVTQEAISLPRKKIVREFGRSINDCFNYFELSLTQERRGRGHFVVYQVDKHIDLKNLILISTWRSAEKGKWKTNKFELGEELNLLSVKYVKKTLYCVFSNGTVHGFNDNDMSLSVVVKSENIPEKLCQDFTSGELRILEAKLVADLEAEEVFLVYPNNNWLVLRLDWSNNMWVEEMSLGWRVLFCFHKHFAKSDVSMLSNYGNFKGYICHRNAASPNFDCFPFIRGCHNNLNDHSNDGFKIRWPLHSPEHLMEAFWFHPPTI